jgi:hypothetical protein
MNRMNRMNFSLSSARNLDLTVVRGAHTPVYGGPKFIRFIRFIRPPPHATGSLIRQ